jgi:hypothetical protein
LNPLVLISIAMPAAATASSAGGTISASSFAGAWMPARLTTSKCEHTSKRPVWANSVIRR